VRKSVTINKDFEEVYRERIERLVKAYQCKTPDRVPISLSANHFAARYAGLTFHEYCYDLSKNMKAALKFAKDFDADSIDVGLPRQGSIYFVLALFKDHPDIAPFLRNWSGPMHDILADRYGRWPGRELPPDYHFQFIFPTEDGFMKTEDYEKFIRDPISFLNETIFPRFSKNLEKPDSAKAYGTWIKIGMQIHREQAYNRQLARKLRKLGFGSPFAHVGYFYPPLDFIGDHLRGLIGIIKDLYLIPETVRKAVDAITPLITELALQTSKPPEELRTADSPLVTAWSTTHLNSMLRHELFEEFYWEPFKKVINELIKENVKPSVLFEGDFTPFLEYLLELPKGQFIALFEKLTPDIRKAREVLGDHVCIVGGLPPLLFLAGTPSKVEEYVKNLLEDVKEPGGFVLSNNVELPPDSRPENIKAAIEAVKKYGWY
jgi:uroporphyrinogen-III decarboxylase